jgi:NADH-quinone oxidoreductase subunit C
MTGQELLDSLGKLFGQKLQNKTEFRGETTYTIRPGDLRETAKFCRDDLSFDYLIDITSIDNFGEEPRFEIVYELYSMTLAVHLRLKLKISEDEEVDTISDLWPTANWHEREIYDMMGIKFKGHPDLRRILMWDGYPFFPLRKEFPLEGLPSEMPDVAFSRAASLEGGPFVTRPSTATAKDREPRARPPEL